MSNPSKAKGTAAEVAVVKWLNANGYPHAERRALAGSSDKGDVAGLPSTVVEVKSCKSHALSQWVDELEAEIVNARSLTGVVIAKRRGTTDPGAWYAIMPAKRWLDLYAEGDEVVS